MKSVFIILGLLIGMGSAFAEPVIVGNLNGVDNISASDAKKLFLGKLKTLPNGTKPIVVEYPDGSAIREEFHSKVTQKSGSQLQAYWSQLVFTGKGTPPKEVSSSAAVIAEITSNSSVIGYIDSTEVTDQLKIIYQP